MTEKEFVDITSSTIDCFFSTYSKNSIALEQYTAMTEKDIKNLIEKTIERLFYNEVYFNDFLPVFQYRGFVDIDFKNIGSPENTVIIFIRLPHDGTMKDNNVLNHRILYNTMIVSDSFFHTDSIEETIEDCILKLGQMLKPDFTPDIVSNKQIL